RWLAAAAERVDQLSRHTRAAVLSGFGWLALQSFQQEDLEPARAALDEALRLYEGLGADAAHARALAPQSYMLQALGDASADDLLKEAVDLAGRSGDEWAMAYVNDGLGITAMNRGDIPSALSHFETAIGHARR